MDCLLTGLLASIKKRQDKLDKLEGEQGNLRRQLSAASRGGGQDEEPRVAVRRERRWLKAQTEGLCAGKDPGMINPIDETSNFRVSGVEPSLAALPADPAKLARLAEQGVHAWVVGTARRPGCSRSCAVGSPLSLASSSGLST